MDLTRILMVLTSSDRMGKSPDPTGFWLEEFAAPYYVFTDTRSVVTVASPRGGKAPIDAKSLEQSAQSASTRRYEADIVAQAKLEHTLKLSSLHAAEYDALFFAGGHGTMDDFATDDSVKSMVEAFTQAGKPVAAVCHGPAALVRALKKNGDPLIKGRKFTCFTDKEETMIGLHTKVPFMLESTLVELGGKSENADAWASHVVIDGTLITGQNPASSIATAEAVIHQLRQKIAA